MCTQNGKNKDSQIFMTERKSLVAVPPVWYKSLRNLMGASMPEWMSAVNVHIGGRGEYQLFLYTWHHPLAPLTTPRTLADGVRSLLAFQSPALFSPYFSCPSSKVDRWKRLTSCLTCACGPGSLAKPRRRALAVGLPSLNREMRVVLRSADS